MKGINYNESQNHDQRVNSEVVNFDVIDSIDAYDVQNDRASYLLNNSKESSIHLGSTEKIRIKSSDLT